MAVPAERHRVQHVGDEVSNQLKEVEERVHPSPRHPGTDTCCDGDDFADPEAPARHHDTAHNEEDQNVEASGEKQRLLELRRFLHAGAELHSEESRHVSPGTDCAAAGQPHHHDSQVRLGVADQVCGNLLVDVVLEGRRQHAHDHAEDTHQGDLREEVGVAEAANLRRQQAEDRHEPDVIVRAAAEWADASDALQGLGAEAQRARHEEAEVPQLNQISEDHASTAEDLEAQVSKGFRVRIAPLDLQQHVRASNGGPGDHHADHNAPDEAGVGNCEGHSHDC